MKILIIGKLWPEPTSSAAGKRMVQLIDLLKFHGTITFACPAQKTGFESELSVETKEIQLNNDSFDDFIRELMPDMVVFDRFMIEEQFGWRVMEQCPNALRILNTEDLHFLRKTRGEALKSGATTDLLTFQNDATMRELAAIYRCDITLLTSDFERDLLIESFGIPAVLLLYLPLFSEGISTTLIPFSERKDVMFIGNFMHAPNLDAVVYLKTEIWPMLLKKRTDISLHIYGAYPNQQVKEFHKPQERFFVHGRAEDAHDVIRQARIMLAPLRFGAGIKGKLLDAMEVGTPSITTPIGSEGIADAASWPGSVVKTSNQFVEAIIELYENEDAFDQCQQKGAEILEGKFKKELYVLDFNKRLQESIQNIHLNRSKQVTAQIIQHQSLLATKYLSKWIMEKQHLK